MPITVYTKQQVLRKLEDFCNRYRTYGEAARRLGCTAAVLSSVRAGNVPPPPSICRGLGLERVKLYASGVEDKHRE